MKRFVISNIFLFFVLMIHAQRIDTLTSLPKISLRGLSVVNDNMVWASGTNGKIARSIDGKNFEWMTVTGYEQRDFRDVEAFDANTAIIMAVDSPAIILKTKDGGKTWKEVFYDDTKGMFLDAMDFSADGKNGIVIGDPVKENFFIAFTTDGGESWKAVKYVPAKNFIKGEAFFAASGTNVKIVHASTNSKTLKSYYVSGGTKSAFYGLNTSVTLPLNQGKETTGANSIDVNDNKIIVVGGDFTDPKDTSGNCVISDNNGRSWMKPKTSPHGYRSCVAFITQNNLITCGLTGVDISNDGGLNWKLISGESYNVCKKSKTGNAVFLAGKDGRISKFVP